MFSPIILHISSLNAFNFLGRFNWISHRPLGYSCVNAAADYRKFGRVYNHPVFFLVNHKKKDIFSITLEGKKATMYILHTPLRTSGNGMGCCTFVIVCYWQKLVSKNDKCRFFFVYYRKSRFLSLDGKHTEW